MDGHWWWSKYKDACVTLGGKGREGACSVSESLITPCHLNPLSAELVCGSVSHRGSGAHLCLLWGFGSSLRNEHARVKFQNCHYSKLWVFKHWKVGKIDIKGMHMGMYALVMHLIGHVKVRTQTANEFIKSLLWFKMLIPQKCKNVIQTKGENHITITESIYILTVKNDLQ